MFNVIYGRHLTAMLFIIYPVSTSRLKVKTMAREIYEQYFRAAEAMPRGVVAKIRNIVQQLEAACAMQISQVRVGNSLLSHFHVPQASQTEILVSLCKI